MKMIVKTSHLLLILIFSGNLFAAEESKNQVPSGLDARVWEQEIILSEAHRLAEKGFYDQAIEKYRESLAPRFIKSEIDKSGFYDGVLRVYRLQGKFREAFNELQWFMKINPKGDGWVDDKLQLEALIKAGDMRSNQPVHDYIKYLREKYKNMLPPVSYDGNYAPIVVSKIIFCYSRIGNADGGIAFMDEIINYFASGKVGKRAEERAFTTRNPYFVIRQAFEQDKKEGFKGCLDAKPGEACMGRATKALIQSDYFPW